MPASGREETSNTRSIPFFTNIIATGFFSGYIPWASGTFGTIVGILIYLLPSTESPAVLSAMIIVGLFTGVWTSGRVADIVGHKLTRSAELAKATFQPGEHEAADPSIVVIDEIVGMWIALLFVPKTIVAVVIAFFAFRAFDIVKPPPARQLERIPNGWGIMLDDVVAGVYANIAIQICLWILRSAFPYLLSF
ncbi:MAG TPA: phosphatidylglycerophosphatase A [Bacteroidetes bacterium]|jgi:phosphatidylglycerophosphatase A|nr:phosphatidylglycerophosphatase A [Bacteroidota bacterium]